MYGMPVGTTAKGQIEPIAKTNQVGERVVLAVMKNTADVCHPNLRNDRLASVYGADGTHADQELRK
jgi:hypothetical protein